MGRETSIHCARCEKKECASDGKDCFKAAEDSRQIYQDERIAGLHRAATAIEGRHYGKETRLREIMLFAREMGARKVGIAFCVGLSSEARAVEEILANEFDVVSVCCKVCGISKDSMNLEKIRPDRAEVTCNPAGQARVLNKAGTDLNVICGLCVGHDAVFSMTSQAPVTTLIAKDRVLAHNPVGAIYCQYVRRRLNQAVEEEGRAKP